MNTGALLICLTILRNFVFVLCAPKFESVEEKLSRKLAEQLETEELIEEGKRIRQLEYDRKLALKLETKHQNEDRNLAEQLAKRERIEEAKRIRQLEYDRKLAVELETGHQNDDKNLAEELEKQELIEEAKRIRQSEYDRDLALKWQAEYEDEAKKSENDCSENNNSTVSKGSNRSKWSNVNKRSDGSKGKVVFDPSIYADVGNCSNINDNEYGDNVTPSGVYENDIDYASKCEADETGETRNTGENKATAERNDSSSGNTDRGIGNPLAVIPKLVTSLVQGLASIGNESRERLKAVPSTPYIRPSSERTLLLPIKPRTRIAKFSEASSSTYDVDEIKKTLIGVHIGVPPALDGDGGRERSYSEDGSEIFDFSQRAGRNLARGGSSSGGGRAFDFAPPVKDSWSRPTNKGKGVISFSLWKPSKQRDDAAPSPAKRTNNPARPPEGSDDPPWKPPKKDPYLD